MKTNICTSREQTDRLLNCGVPAESADMFYQTPITASQKAKREYILLVRANNTLFDTDIPAFSLSALLSLLPKEIDIDGTTYKLNIDYPPIGQVAVRYNTEDDDLDSLFGLMGDDLFELIILMVEKLTANGYKLNGIKKGGEV